MVVPRKYNPGFLSDDEIVALFCVRMIEFESIMEMLRECTGTSNPHQIVIGPRGSGKTTLLLRVAAEVRRDAELSERLFPIVFAEESYEVGSAGEFWLECLGRLAVQAPERDGAPDLHSTYNELRSIQDDQALGDRCLGALLDFSDREGKRLVLIAENLNAMFRDMGDRIAGWRLRKVLQTEPRIVLLASATSRFDQIDDPDQALYELFRVLTLRPLDEHECAVLWEGVTGQTARHEAIRALRILVGGSPRLFVIFGRFGADLSFRQLMADLLDLVDDHTEYFKSHLEVLAPQERRVYLALADLWKPATTKEVADGARLETSKCSAQLARLAERQIVQVVGGTARRKQYYLAERLYNIYHLLRRPRGPDRLVESLIRFMASYYSPRELTKIGAEIVRAADSVSGDMLPLEQAVLVQLLKVPALGEGRSELRELMPAGLWETLGPAVPPASGLIAAPGTKPDSAHVDALPGDDADTSTERLGMDLLEKARAVRKRGRADEALAVYDDVVQRYGESQAPALVKAVATALFEKGATLAGLNRLEEALGACHEVVSRYGASEAPGLREMVARALFNSGFVLGASNRLDEALDAYGKVVGRYGASEAPGLREVVADALVDKGLLLAQLNRPEEALAAYTAIVQRFGDEETPALVETVARAIASKAVTLEALNRPEEALAACDEVVRRYGTADTPNLVKVVAGTLLNKGAPLQALNRLEEAVAVCDEVVRRHGASEAPDLLELVAKALANKGTALRELNRLDEALTAFDEVIDRFAATETPAVAEAVAASLCDKGAVLGILNRPEEALVVLDQVVAQYGTSEVPRIRRVAAKALVNQTVALHRLGRPEEALVVLDEVTSRYGRSSEPGFLEIVADGLLNRGFALAALNRPEEALMAHEEVVRRFGASEAPEVLASVATALLNKGVQLVTLDRPEEALATFDEVVNRYGATDVPAVLKSVASALINKGTGLAALNRPEEALATYGEVVHRFGTSEASVLREAVAGALVNIGVGLGALDRPEEELVVYDEVVHRFGESESPILRHEVAVALVNRGITLGALNRPEEGLAAYDEVVHRFGESESPGLLRMVAVALVNRGASLTGLGRLEDAAAAYGEVARRFGEETSRPQSEITEYALLQKAHLELRTRRYKAAIRTADLVLEQRLTDSPEIRIRSHLVRARATLAKGDVSECEKSVETSLAILSRLDSVPSEPIYALMELSVELGSAQVLDLIRASPAVDLLLPLSTALEQELGLEPRVAREVEKVARDIRQELGRLRDAR